MYQPRWGRFWLCAIFCGFLEAAIGCRGSSVVAVIAVVAVVAGAAAAVAIASFGAACTELGGNEEEFCRLSGALTAGEAGETIGESVALGLRGSARECPLLRRLRGLSGLRSASSIYEYTP